jgi:protein MAK11
LVKFSPKGTHFAVLFPKKVEIYSLTLKKLYTLETKARFNAVLFAVIPGEEEGEEKEVLCIGTEKGVVEVYEVEIGSEEPVEEEEGLDDTEKDLKGDEDEEGNGGADITKIGELIGHTNR